MQYHSNLTFNFAKTAGQIDSQATNGLASGNAGQGVDDVETPFHSWVVAARGVCAFPGSGRLGTERLL